MFINRAIKLGHYHVYEYYFNNWLPYKALIEHKAASKIENE